MYLKNQLDGVEKPFVSVIVPIYNVEDYLSECLDSIQKQTYPNLEILLIDDGSTDFSGKIADDFAKKEKRASVFHIKNSGLAEARNVGITYITSPYVSFVDSDDVLSPFFIENHMKAIFSTGASMSKGQFAKWRKELNYKKAKAWVLGQGSEVMDLNFRDYHGEVSACFNVYKSDLFLDTNIRFPKGMYYEDFAIFAQIMHKADKVVFLKEKDYYYRPRVGSIISQGFNPKMFDFFKVVDDYVKPFFHKYYPKQIKYIYQKEISEYTIFTGKIPLFSTEPQYRKIYINKIYNISKKNPNLNFLAKIFSKSKIIIIIYIIMLHYIMLFYFFLKKFKVCREEKRHS
jgi:glycosyltransferase involved in cell wall biosynthesis